jgi:hypothetical protein
MTAVILSERGGSGDSDERTLGRRLAQTDEREHSLARVFHVTSLGGRDDGGST